MSIDIMERLWGREDLDSTTLLVGLALANYAGADGECWPSVETIRRRSRLKSVRSVQAAIGRLCGMGLLRRHQRQDSSNVYVFVLDNLPHAPRTRGEKERSLIDMMAGASPAGAPLHQMHPPPQEMRAPPAGDAPRTVIEPSDEPSFLDSGDLASPAARPSLSAYVEKRWHELKAEHPGIADVRKIDDGLRHTIELRAQQHAREGEDGYAVWDEFFETVSKSPFLTGRAPPGKDRDTPFKLSLPWAVKAHNFREIIGGKYNGTRDPNTFDASSGRRLGPTDQAVRGSVARLRAAQQLRRGRGDSRGYLGGPSE